jgi:hypothetical protein
MKQFSLLLMGCLLVTSASTGVSFGEEVTDENSRAAQLVRMKAIADRFEISALRESPSPAKLIDKPLLRYNDSTRQQYDESTLWMWTERELPVALMGVEYYPKRKPEPRWLSEIVSLSGAKIGVARDGSWKWEARQPGLIRQPVPDSSKPADTAVLRLTQGRQIRQRFTAHERESSDGRIELRPLSNPLYRFKDEATGVLDGMIFAYANGTNPEVLLILEAVRDQANGNAGWTYGFAQMTGARVHASLDDREVWKQGEADPPATRDSYVNDWLADEVKVEATK